MITIGQFNYLKITQKNSRGVMLSAGPLGLVFLPVAQLPSYCEVGDKIQVFLYRDNKDEVVATTQKPRVELGGVACLKVNEVTPVGAFMDWGLPKDLLVPFGEQAQKMAKDELHIVYVYEDNTGRICASSKLNKFIKGESEGLKTGSPVSLIVGEKTDLGYKMVVDGKFWGILHLSDIFREIRYGQCLKGYVKNVRADKRIDITLKKPGFEHNESLASKILSKLQEKEGFLPLSDKSDPELIYQTFGVSKKVFKAEIGSLYRQHKILIEKNGIYLAKN